MRTGKERHLPKPQRRGAIIILGMLAVAKRSVLTDKVDVMLKIGLGPLGRVGTFLFYSLFTLNLIYCVFFFQADPILARYTCVALQRLNGSAKKVKGMLCKQALPASLSQKTLCSNKGLSSTKLNELKWPIPSLQNCNERSCILRERKSGLAWRSR